MSAQGAWPEEAGILTLPSGRRIRGRALRRPLVGPAPDFGLYLLSRPPDPPPLWSWRWVEWADFRLPTSAEDAGDAIAELWQRAVEERVEVGCHGGRGRTGTVLACLAVLDGVSADEAIGLVRRHYHRGAVETPGQRRFVAALATIRDTR